jgi:hypothetical protein
MGALPRKHPPARRQRKRVRDRNVLFGMWSRLDLRDLKTLTSRQRHRLRRETVMHWRLSTLTELDVLMRVLDVGGKAHDELRLLLKRVSVVMDGR